MTSSLLHFSLFWLRLERLDAATIRNQEYRSPAGAGGPRFIGFNLFSTQLRVVRPRWNRPEITGQGRRLPTACMLPLK
jgi:hypothetical protein